MVTSPQPPPPAPPLLRWFRPRDINEKKRKETAQQLRARLNAGQSDEIGQGWCALSSCHARRRTRLENDRQWTGKARRQPPKLDSNKSEHEKRKKETNEERERERERGSERRFPRSSDEAEHKSESSGSVLGFTRVVSIENKLFFCGEK